MNRLQHLSHPLVLLQFELKHDPWQQLHDLWPNCIDCLIKQLIKSEGERMKPVIRYTQIGKHKSRERLKDERVKLTIFLGCTCPHIHRHRSAF